MTPGAPFVPSNFPPPPGPFASSDFQTAVANIVSTMFPTAPTTNPPPSVPEDILQIWREIGGRRRHTPASTDPNAIPVRKSYDDPLVPGRGRTTALTRQERREPLVYLGETTPDTYDLIDLFHSWVARCKAQGCSLPEETLVKTILPQLLSKASSAVSWFIGSGGTEGYLSGAFPPDSLLGKVIKSASYVQGVSSPDQLDWLHILLECLHQIERRFGQLPSQLQAQLVSDYHFRKNLPGRLDPMIPNESLMNFAERFYAAYRKIKRAEASHNSNGSTYTLSTKMLQQSICKEADDFLGVCDKTGRRYLDPVILMLNSDENITHERFIGALTKAWNVKCHLDAQLSSLSVQHDLISHSGKTSTVPRFAAPRAPTSTSRPAPYPAPPPPLGLSGQPASPAAGRGLHDACLIHGGHTNRSCRLTETMNDNALLQHLRSLPKVSVSATDATDINTFVPMTDEEYYGRASVLSTTVFDTPTEDIVLCNATGAQQRNRAVVDLRTAAPSASNRTVPPPSAHATRTPPSAPRALLPPPPAGSADEPTRLKDGSTACCNRTQCPGPSKCWWLHPDLCYNADTFFSRYRNELKYGKERAAFTAAVEDAWRAGRPVPTLAEFRRQHPHLVGTSSHREPFNPAHAYHSSTIEVSEDAYSVPPLTEDLH